MPNLFAPVAPTVLASVEIAAWTSMHRVLTPAQVAASGSRTRKFGGLAAYATDSSDSLVLNHVLGLGLFEPATPALLDDLVTFFNHRPFAIELAPGAQPAELPAWLAARGFRPSFDVAVHHRSVDDFPEVPTDVRIERVRPTRAPLFAEVKADALGKKAISAGDEAVAASSRWHAYLAFEGQTPIATAAMYIEGEGAWLGFAATVPEFRRRGAQSALVARRVRDARLLGCSFVTTETDVDDADVPNFSFRNMVRLGFSHYRRPNYVFSAP